MDLLRIPSTKQKKNNKKNKQKKKNISKDKRKKESLIINGLQNAVGYGYDSSVARSVAELDKTFIMYPFTHR